MFHTEMLVLFGVGWALLILAAGFGVYGFATGRRQAWVFWLCPLLYSWFMTKRPSQFPRWVLPLLPFVAVAGAARHGRDRRGCPEVARVADRPSGAARGQATTR